ncbi:hypothetical protein BH11MYX1_BH11MYX1_18950 [soil metagenome]
MRLVFTLLLVATPAAAERVVVLRGETLEHVALAHGCTTEQVERANHLEISLVPAGTVVEVPACSKRAVARLPSGSDDDARAKQALAVIDGATWVKPAPAPVDETHWSSMLAHAAKLGPGAGYVVRHPTRAYGEKYVVEYLRHSIAEVRALYPNVPTLAIGDISAEHGGKISDHVSHQTGVDVDVGFYFKITVESFATAGPTFDLEANWALLAAFARTAALDDGVKMIFLDYEIQRRLYNFAQQRGTPESELEFMFQYPRGRDELSGLVRHWPGHDNHFHVRFKPAQ